MYLIGAYQQTTLRDVTALVLILNLDVLDIRKQAHSPNPDFQGSVLANALRGRWLHLPAWSLKPDGSLLDFDKGLRLTKPLQRPHRLLMIEEADAGQASKLLAFFGRSQHGAALWSADILSRLCSDRIDALYAAYRDSVKHPQSKHSAAQDRAYWWEQTRAYCERVAPITDLKRRLQIHGGRFAVCMAAGL